MHPIYKFLNETPDRVPMTDWCDTITGKQVGFQARSVVGGVYIKMLAEPAMWKNVWSAARLQAKSSVVVGLVCSNVSGLFVEPSSWP
ncbi:MAG: DUF1793 domain-containing protein [Acidobacteriaceae bacterium]